jgi:3-dehydroquinate synthase
MIHRQIDVKINEHPYSIYAGADMIASFAPMCRRHGISDSVVVITDRNVASYHLSPLLRGLVRHKFSPMTIIIPAGETQKNLRRSEAIYTEMLKKKIPRDTTVIALGGGVVGDLAGFIAATYQRGVKLIQIPTTLLAQVDSSIGGKVGINHALGKNMIGAFHQPKFVWMDAGYLQTLPMREVLCGIGEVVKYGIIRDTSLFEFTKANFKAILQLDAETLTHILIRCAEIKADIVSRDEKESGVRIILNCGHTIGHGLEFAGRYKLLKHGEAVLYGMLAESFIAKKMKLLNSDEYERIAALISDMPIKAKLSALKTSDVINAMERDKKRVGAKLRFVLPVKIGDVKVVDNVKPQLIDSAIKEIKGI